MSLMILMSLKNRFDELNNGFSSLHFRLVIFLYDSLYLC